MWYNLFRAIIAEREQRSAAFARFRVNRRHHRRGALAHRDERINADVHRHQEIIEAGVDIAAAQFVLVGKADRMDHEIDRRPAFGQRSEARVEITHIRYVAGNKEVLTQLGGEWSHALFQRLALVAKRKLRAMFGQLLRDTPGERLVVREPHDEPALALHQSIHAVAASASLPMLGACVAGVCTPLSGGSASAAFRCAPKTMPSPTR